ncbi:MAG TPA: lysophospholipid acyltransferase family protein [Candidatus Dormibacteraeota bacterium]|nr:lysophospholipid acyltransferase family protein [Candidatus Dormibacteraeota bacterium]
MTLYALARGLLLALFRTVWRMRVAGTEHVPRSGPLILACNHVSYLDPPVLGCAAPRPVTFMAKIELFRIPVLGPLIAAVGAFPVDRGKGDVVAIRTAVKELERGGCIGIFPEGGRVRPGEERAAQPGVALLAYLSRARVVPAAIVGSNQAIRLTKISVRFGEPMELRPAAKKATREELEAFASAVLANIRALHGQEREHRDRRA